MNFLKCLVVMIVANGLLGCSSGITVVKKPEKNDRLAILMFEDCKKDMDCPGSGKKVSDFYSQVFNAPVIMFDADAKGYDILLKGKVISYNEAVPMAGNGNFVGVDLTLNRVSDGTELITHKKVKGGSNLFSSTKGLSQDLANALKESMN